MKPTGVENATLGITMHVGPTEVALDKKKTLAQKNKEGVPVHVDPILMKPTGAENMTLGLNMRIGPDEISVKKAPAKASFV